MKKKLKLFLDQLNTPKTEKILMIVLPVLAVTISILILAPQAPLLAELISGSDSEIKAYADEPRSGETVSVPTAAPQTENGSNSVQLRFVVSSMERDLYIRLSDENEMAVDGKFTIFLRSPGGDEFIYSTEADGSCYIVELEPGEYVVSMADEPGFLAAPPVHFTVEDRVAVPNSVSISGRAGWQEQDGKTYYLNNSGIPALGLKKIDGKFYYFNNRGEKARAVGIDVSCFNEDIDWQAVRGQGLDFVILRAGGRGWSTGLVYRDQRFHEYMRGARSVGAKLGLYFYSTAVNVHEAVEEAEFVLSLLDGAPLDYPIFIDMEYSGSYPSGRADRLTMYERHEIVKAFSNVVENRGYRAGFYSGQYLMDRAVTADYFTPCTIWLANYTGGITPPSYSGRYDIWQFTENARVEGIPGTVDMNVIF
ncbi:MAG: GH25 family lysozyme [Candidatus Limivicinus sp.]|jgi:GH25 family lysozyme M1 (1,4-beta-N-acetylmuramidase)